MRNRIGILALAATFAASCFLSACNDNPSSSTAVVEQSGGIQIESMEQCQGYYSASQCETIIAQSRPTFTGQNYCESAVGAGQCIPVVQGGYTYWSPLAVTMSIALLATMPGYHSYYVAPSVVALYHPYAPLPTTVYVVQRAPRAYYVAPTVNKAPVAAPEALRKQTTNFVRTSAVPNAPPPPPAGANAGLTAPRTNGSTPNAMVPNSPPPPPVGSTASLTAPRSGTGVGATQGALVPNSPPPSPSGTSLSTGAATAPGAATMGQQRQQFTGTVPPAPPPLPSATGAASRPTGTATTNTATVPRTTIGISPPPPPPSRDRKKQ